jgi:hypothetical protein
MPYLDSQNWTAGTWDDRTAESQRSSSNRNRDADRVQETSGSSMESFAAGLPVSEPVSNDGKSSDSWSPTDFEDVLDELVDGAGDSSQDEAILSLFGG